MTSSNVSNMLVQVSSVSVEVQGTKIEPVKNNGLFEKTLKNVAESNVSLKDFKPESVKLNDNDSIKTVNEKMNSVNDSRSSKVNTKEVNETTRNTSDEDREKMATLVEETADKVKEVIAEELDVSKEDVENAMETLGLTAIDLFNPQSLAELTANITGEEDSIALVMNEGFKDILDSVTELTNQLFDETGITFTQIKEAVITPVSENNEMLDESIPNQVELSQQETIIDERPNVGETRQIVPKSERPVEVPQDEDLENVPIIEIKVDNKEGQTENQNMSDSKTDDSNDFKQVFKSNEEPVIRNDGMIFGEPKFEIQFFPEEQVVTLPTGQTVTPKEIVNQLVEQARVLNEAESTTMEMTLNPEGLGKIFMEVTQKGDEITAKIFTENDAVKQALESQMANLRLEMNQSSTKVTSIEVSVGTHEFERNLEENANGEQRRDEQANQPQKRNSRINLNSLDELSGLMSEEDLLIANMMRDNGNTLDFQA